MELARHHIVLPDTGRKGDVIRRGRGCNLLVPWIHKKGMHKIAMGPVGYAFEHRTVALDVDLIPAHVWNLENLVL